MSDKITLYISHIGAERAGNKAMRPGIADFEIRPATLRDDDTGHIERGFRVILLNSAGHPVGNL